MVTFDPSRYALDICWGDVTVEHDLIIAKLRESEVSDADASMHFFDLARLSLALADIERASRYLLRSYQLNSQFRPALYLARLLYIRREDFRVAAKLLEAESNITETEHTRAALLRFKGKLLLRTEEDKQALSALKQAADLQATDLEARELLFSLFGTTSRAARLSTGLSMLEASDEPQSSAAIAFDVGLAAFEHDATTQLSDLARTALTLDPSKTDISTGFAIELFSEMLGDYDAHVSVLEWQADCHYDDPNWKTLTLLRASWISRYKLADLGRSIGLLQKADRIQSNVNVSADLFRLLVATKRYPEAISAGNVLYRLVDDAKTRTLVAFSLAKLCTETAGTSSAEQAVSWQKKCLEADPSFQPAIEDLCPTLERHNEIDDLVTIHLREAERFKRPLEQADRVYRAGHLLEHRQRNDEAINLFEQALKRMPNHYPSLFALEHTFFATERWEKLSQLLIDQLFWETNTSRKLRLKELNASILLEHLSQPKEAIEQYIALSKESNEAPHILRRAAQIATKLRQWRALATLVDVEARLTGNVQRRINLQRQLGYLFQYHLDDEQTAIEYYQAAITHNPTDGLAFQALSTLLTRHQHWSDLARLYENYTEADSDSDYSILVLFKLSQLYEHQIDDTGRAAAVYQRILKRKPDHLAAIQALEEIFTKNRQFSDLATLLETTVEALDPGDPRARQLARVGAIVEQHLQHDDRGCRQYLAALRAVQHDRVIRQLMLHNLVFLEKDTQQIADIATNIEGGEWLLEELFFRLTRTGQATHTGTSLLEAALPKITSLNHAIRMLHMPSMLDSNRNIDDVVLPLKTKTDDSQLTTIADWERFVSNSGSEAPDSFSDIDGRMMSPFLKHLLRQTDKTTIQFDLPTLLSEAETDSLSGLETAWEFVTLGDLLFQQGRLAEAEQAFCKAMDSPQVPLRALLALCDIHEQREHWSALVGALQRLASQCSAPEHRSQALMRAAEVAYHKLHDRDTAIRIYRAILTESPNHVGAHDQLEGLLAIQEDWRGLSEALAARSQASVDTPSRRSALLCTAAQLIIDNDHNEKTVSKAETYLAKAHEIHPSDADPVVRLGDLHFSQRKWDAARISYQNALSLPMKHDKRSQLLRRLGESFLSLGDPHSALDVFHEALDLGAAFDLALWRTIASCAKLIEDHQRHVLALETIAQNTDDPTESLEARKQAAFIAEERLDDLEAGISSLQKVLALQPLDVDAILRLSAMYGRLGQRKAADDHLDASIAQYRSAIQKMPDNPRLYQQLARIFRWQRDLDALFCTSVVCSHLGSAEEASFVNNHKAQCNQLISNEVSFDRLLALTLPTNIQTPVDSKLRELGGLLRRVHIESPQRYGLHRSQRAAKNHPFRQTLAPFLRMFGDPDIQLWLNEQSPDMIAAANFERPSLIVGVGVTSSSLTASHRFHLGRSLFLIAQKALFLQDKSIRTIRSFFQALLSVADPPISHGNISVEQDAEHLRQSEELRSSLRRKDRKHLGTLLPELVALSPNADLSDFAWSLHIAADRMGAVFSLDPIVAISELTLLSDDHSGLFVQTLLPYLISAEYLTLRQELGVAPADDDSHRG